MNRTDFERQLAKFKILSTIDNVDGYLLSEGRKENARAIASNLSDDQFQQLLDGDPSKASPQNPYKYIEWMAKQAKLSYNLNDIIGLVKVYDQNISIIPKDKPLQNFKTLPELYNFISALDDEGFREFEQQATDKKAEQYIKTEQDKFQTVKETDEYIISRVINTKGSCELGKMYKAKWCLAGGLEGDAYQPSRAREYFNDYVGDRNILYFVVFKKAKPDDKIFAIIIHTGLFDKKNGLSSITEIEIWTKKDDPITVDTFNKTFNDASMTIEVMNLMKKDAISTSVYNNAISRLETVKNPEQLKSLIDTYSKLFTKDQFGYLMSRMYDVVDPAIIDSLNLSFSQESSLDISQIIKKGVFVTKNINQASIEAIGQYLEKISKEKNLSEQKNLHETIFQYFIGFLNSISKTEYLFMLNKASQLNSENIIYQNGVYTDKGKGLFYTLISPLLKYTIVNQPASDGGEGKQISAIMFNGINEEYLNILKNELSKRSNNQLRNLFGKIVVGARIPIKDKLERDYYSFEALKTFVNQDQSQLTYVREVCRQIVDTISKTPYSAMSGKDVESILEYTEKDFYSLQTDESREENIKKYSELVPKLSQVLRYSFDARKTFIKKIYDDFHSNKEIYNYKPKDNSYVRADDTNIKQKNIFFEGTKVSDLLLQLDREEMSHYLVFTQNNKFENIIQNQNQKRYDLLVDYISSLTISRRPETALDGVFNAAGSDKTSFIELLAGPENKKSYGGNIPVVEFTEEERLNIAYRLFYDIDIYKEYHATTTTVQAVKKIANQGEKQRKKTKEAEVFNKTVDTILDEALMNVYIKEEEHMLKIVEELQYFADNPKILNATKDPSYYLQDNRERGVGLFLIYVTSKLYNLIKIAAIFQDSVILTNNYGNPQKKQKIIPVIKNTLLQKINIYKSIIQKFSEIVVKFKSKGRTGGYNTPSNRNLETFFLPSRPTATDLPNILNILEKLSQNIVVEQTLSENKKIIVRLNHVR